MGGRGGREATAMIRRVTTSDEAIDTGIKPGGKPAVSLRKKIFG